MKSFNGYLKENKDLEVIETIDVGVSTSHTVEYLSGLMGRILNKTVSGNFYLDWKDTSKGTKEETFFVKRTEVILINIDKYAIVLQDKNGIKHSLSPRNIKILGKRMISPEDPYGEEDWEK